MDNPWNFYLLKVWDDNVSFLKFGHTGRSLIARFRGKEYLHLKWIEILFVTATKREILGLEEAIKEKFSHFRVLPPSKFPGYTECLSEAVLLDVCEFVDDFKQSA